MDESAELPLDQQILRCRVELPCGCAAASSKLDRRTFERAIGTEHAAITLLRSDQGAAPYTVMEVDAGIKWHRLRRHVSAVGTCQTARGLRVCVHCVLTLVDEVFATSVRASRAKTLLSSLGNRVPSSFHNWCMSCFGCGGLVPPIQRRGHKATKRPRRIPLLCHS